jgi:hypothetical protein
MRGHGSRRAAEFIIGPREARARWLRSSPRGRNMLRHIYRPHPEERPRRAAEPAGRGSGATTSSGRISKDGRTWVARHSDSVFKQPAEPTLRRPGCWPGAGFAGLCLPCFRRVHRPRKPEEVKRRTALVRNAAPVARLAIGPVSEASETPADDASRRAFRRFTAATSSTPGP